MEPAELKAEEQDIFNTTVLHLRAQNTRSVYETRPGIFHCLYRSSEGLKCAVGCLVPDEKYNSEMERWDLEGALGCLSKPLEEKLTRHIELLKFLQDCHDAFEVNMWELRLDSIAAMFDLTMPPRVNQ